MERCFVAFELSEELREGARERQAELRRAEWARSVKWVEPENFHLTIRFLGELDARQAAEAGAVVRGVHRAFEEIRVVLGGIGAFPALSRPQVLWCSVRSDRLASVATVINQSLSGAGFGPPDKPWVAHLTLGRARGDARLPSLVGETEARLTLPEVESSIDRISLFRSDLRPQQPPLYTVRERAIARPAESATSAQ